MSQHAGMSSDPIIRLFDYILVRQMICKAVGVFGSSVHSRVNGRVTAIAPHCHLISSQDVVSITIKSNGKDAPHRSIIPIDYWDDLDVIVINVSTARVIADAFLRGIPPIERAVTVSSEKTKQIGQL